MLHCPICNAHLVPHEFRQHFRRGDRWIEVLGEEMRCPSGHPGEEGESYFSVITDEQAARFHEAVQANWHARYGEPMPPRRAAGRKGREQAQGVVVRVELSPIEVAKVDAERGALSRSDFIKRRATG